MALDFFFSSVQGFSSQCLRQSFEAAWFEVGISKEALSLLARQRL